MRNKKGEMGFSGMLIVGEVGQIKILSVEKAFEAFSEQNEN